MAKRLPLPAIKPAIDPTLGLEPLELDGTTYYPCFDFDALAAAESSLTRQGKDVNLLYCFPPATNFSGMRVLFAASIHKSHPDISFEEAQKVVTPGNWLPVLAAINKTWNRDVAPDEEEGKASSPPEPEA